jgi:hypothetical protein
VVEILWHGDDRDGRHGNLMIEDRSGDRTGCRADENGLNCEDEIKGSKLDFPRLGGEAVWERSGQPIYRLPDDDYTVELSGGDVEGSPNEGVSLVRDGVTFAVDNVELEQDERYAIEIDGDRMTFENREGGSEGARIRFGYQRGEAWSFRLGARGVDEGAEVAVDLDRKREELELEATGDRGLYQLQVVRTTADGSTVLEDEKLSFKAGSTATIEYGRWRAGDDSAPVAKTA